MENHVLKAIAERRSTRGFKSVPLTEEQLNALIFAATASPSAMNLQSWHFTFCSDAAAILAVEEQVGKIIMTGEDDAAKQRMKSRNMKVFYDAPTVVFISSDTQNGWSMLDAGIAAENIVLAAQSMGLGSVIVGMCKIAFEGKDGERFNNMLNFPQGYTFSLAVALGTPKVSKDAHPVGENKVTVM